MFDKTGDVVYYDTNIIKLFDELSFKKIGGLITMKMIKIKMTID